MTTEEGLLPFVSSVNISERLRAALSLAGQQIAVLWSQLRHRSEWLEAL